MTRHHYTSAHLHLRTGSHSLPPTTPTTLHLPSTWRQSSGQQTGASPSRCSHRCRGSILWKPTCLTLQQLKVREATEDLSVTVELGPLIAVTQAGFIVASVLVAFGIPRPGTRARLDPRHTSLTEWRFADGIWQLERYNDICHLGTESWPGVVLAPPDR